MTAKEKQELIEKRMQQGMTYEEAVANVNELIDIQNTAVNNYVKDVMSKTGLSESDAMYIYNLGQQDVGRGGTAATFHPDDPYSLWVVRTYPKDQWQNKLSYRDTQYGEGSTIERGDRYKYKFDEMQDMFVLMGYSPEDAASMANQIIDQQKAQYMAPEAGEQMFQALMGNLVGGAFSGAIGNTLGNFGLPSNLSGNIGSNLSSALLGGNPDWGNVMGDLAGSFIENPFAAGLLENILPTGGGGMDLSSILGDLLGGAVGGDWGGILGDLLGGLLGGGGGGGIGDISDIFSGINLPGFDLSGILGKDAMGSMDDYLRQYGIPLALGYLGKEEAEPWTHMSEDAIRAQMGLGTSAEQLFNKYITGNTPYDWSNPTQMTGGTAPTAGGMTPSTTGTAGTAPDTYYDLADLLPIKESFGTMAGEAGFNQAADLNRDNVIDMKDMAVLKQRFGTPVENYEGTTTPPQNVSNYSGAEYGSTTAGISPYEQLVSMQAYGMMNPLGTAEEQAALGKLTDRISQEYALQRQNVLESGQRMNQPPEIIQARLDEIDVAEGLAKQESARDTFMYGQQLGRDYQTSLANTLSPMWGMPSTALGAYGQAGAGAGQMAGDIMSNYSNLAQSLAYSNAMSNQQDPLEMAMAIMTAMQGQQQTQPIDINLTMPGGAGGAGVGTSGGGTDWSDTAANALYNIIFGSGGTGTGTSGGTSGTGGILDPSTWGSDWGQYGYTDQGNILNPATWGSAWTNYGGLF